MADNQVKIILSALDQTKSAFDSVRSGFRSLDSQSKSSLSSISSEWKKLGATIGGVFGTYQAAAFIKGVVDAQVAMDRMNVAMQSAMGSSQASAASMSFVRAEAQRLGLSLQESAQGYIKIAAAAKGTAMEGEPVKQIFSAVAEASTALSLTADETNGALLAISQMMSKGKVSAEELRGQLGERLPSAFQIAAKAMGVSTAQLDKMLQEGRIVADDFLPKFAVALHTHYAGAIKKASQSSQSNLSRAKTAIFDFKATLGEAFGSATTDSVNAVTTAMERFQTEVSKPEAREAIRQLSEEFAELIIKAGEEAPEALRKMLSALNSIMSFYNTIPGELVAAGSMGVVGKLLFNNQVGVILASITAINSALSRVGMNIGAIPGKFREGAGAMQNIIDAVTGKRDWRTGAYKGGSISGQADVAGLAAAEARMNKAASAGASLPRSFSSGISGVGKATKGTAAKGDSGAARLIEQWQDVKRNLEANISTEGLGEFRKALIQNQLEADNLKDRFKGLPDALKQEAYALFDRERLRQDELSRKKEEEAQSKSAVDSEKKAADMRREVAEAQKEAERRAYEVRENAINQQLFEMDLAEQAGASHREGLADRIRLTEELLSGQRAYLETIDKAADPSSYYSQVDAINQTRSAILVLKNESDEAYGSFFSGWTQGWNEFREQSITAFTAARDAVTEFTDSATDYLSNVFFDVIQGKFENLKDYFRSFCNSILKIFTDMLAQMVVKQAASDIGGLFGSIGGLFGLAGGGSAAAAAGSTYTASSLGSVFSSGLVFHSGGKVGVTAAPRRFVPSLAFAGAPRLHGGLMPDEFPAILQRGETVIPKGQGSSNGSLQQNVNVTIVAADAKSFSDMVRRNPSAVIKPITDALRDNSINREWKTLLG